MRFTQHALNCAVVIGALAALAQGGEVQLVEGRPLDEQFVLRFELNRTGDATADLFLHWKDRENNCSLAFSSAGVRILRRQGGVETELGASNQPVAASAAYVLRRTADRFELFHDGKSALEAGCNEPRLGKLGVATSGGAKFTGLKYQALSPISYHDNFMRAPEDRDPWTVHRGNFSIGAVSHPELSVSPFRYVGSAEGGGDALAAHGDWFWADYDVHAAMRAAPVTSGETVSSYFQCRGTPHAFLPEGRLDVLDTPDVSPALTAERSPVELGLAFAVESPTTYRMLRIAAGTLQEAQLVEVRDGNETILARKTVRLPPRQWFSLRVLARGGAARCYVDNCLAFARNFDGLLQGPVGLWTRGADGKQWEAQFNDVAVASLDGVSRESLLAETESPELRSRLELPDPGGTRVPNYFTYQPTMEEWADPRNTYVPRGEYSWYVGTLFEAAEVRWHPENELFKSGAWSAVIAPDDAEPDPALGYRVALEVSPDGQANVTAFRKNVALESRKVEFNTARGARSICAAWRAGHLQLLIDDREAAAFDDPQPLVKRAAVGVSVNGAPASPTSLDVLSTHLLDETFAHSPVEWRSAAGSWEVTSRWACSPRYTWFGGKGVGSSQSVLFSKRAFGGDLVLDAYFAQGMSDRFTPFYDRPLNFAVSFCTDGRDLFSGYTFWFGFQDAPARLYRQNEVVAESNKFVDPYLRSGVEPLFRKLHQAWRHLRIERSGKRVRCLVDGKLLAEYDDPTPLPAGPAALWTMGSNGVMLARVRLAFESGGEFASPFIPAPKEAAPLPLETTGEWRAAGADLAGAAVRIEPDSERDAPDAVRATNLRSGGHFAIARDLHDTDAAKLPNLTFQYRIAPGARINAYLKFKGLLWRIALTGPARNTAHSLPLWTVPDVKADGAWHRADAPCLDALRAQFPNEAAFPLEAVVFGNYEEDDGLFAGLGGNAPGAQYSVAGAAFVAANGLNGPAPAGAPSPETVKPAAAIHGGAPLLDCDFERDTGPFESFDGNEGVYTFRESLPLATDADNHCLRVSAKAMGGCFGLYLRRQAFDVRKYPVLEFDIAIDPATQINLQAMSGELRFEWNLTDPTPGWDVIGQAGDVVDDGRWHHVRIDLLAGAEAATGGRSPLNYMLRDLAISDTGFAGNTSSGCYRLDNLRLAAAPARKNAGFAPPVLSGPYPADGARTCSGEVRARIADSGGGLSLQDLRFEVNGKPFRAGEGRMRFDSQAGIIRLRLPAEPGGAPFETGAPVNVALYAQDLDGNAAQPLTWSFTFDPAAWTAAPPAPYIVAIPGDRHVFEDYESGIGSARNRRGTIVSHDKEGALGSGSLAVTARLSGDVFFQSTLVSKSFDAAKYPIVSFDLQLHTVPNFTLMFVVRNRFKMLTLYGMEYTTNDDWETLGSQEFPYKPESWVHVRVDLRKHFPELQRGERLPVSAICTAGNGNMIGATLRIDNLCVSSDKSPDLEFQWRPPSDPSGIKGYAAVLDQNPNTTPPEELTTREPQFIKKAAGPGTWYLHVRAVNGAGRWSPAAHAKANVE